VNGYCITCKKVKKVTDPIRTKIRNKKSKSGYVEAWIGNCSTCDSIVYKIIGHH
jgi:hypothetical protein